MYVYMSLLFYPNNLRVFVMFPNTSDFLRRRFQESFNWFNEFLLNN